MCSVADLVERGSQFGPPAEPGARLHCCAERLRPGKSPATSAGEPGGSLIEAGRDLGEVESRFLDPGSGRQAGGVSSRFGPSGAMDRDGRSPDVAFVASDGEAPWCGDRDMDHRG